MKEEIKVCFAQFDIVWENPQANRLFLDQLLKNHRCDLVVLPEMFTTGFSMNVQNIAEEAFGESFDWMKSKAIEGNCAICGSISTHDNGKFYNRFYFVTPKETTIYDKKHLFSYGKEPQTYASGNEIVSVDFLGWKFRLVTCYDIRFPVWCRNTDDYDALLCVASWPITRIEAWKTLLKARAMENMAFVVGVNRTGTDGYDLVYDGNSKAYNSLGEEVHVTQLNTSLFQTEFSKSELKQNRGKFHFLDDRDSFQILT